jgi:predicted aspartyl protease
MVRNVLLACAATLACNSPALAQVAPAPAPADGTAAAVDKASQAEDIRFRNEMYNRMTVPVRLSGAGPFRFIVDTGANRTAISTELASRLNLIAGEGGEMHSTTGVSTVATAKLPELQLTRKAVKQIDAPLLQGENIGGADGILGTDSLALQRVEFDFQAQTMAVVPANTPDFREEPGTIVVEARRKNGRLIVTEATANGRNIVVVVDTGSQVTIANEALRKALSRSDLLPQTYPVDLISVTGDKLNGDYMFLRDLEIGGVILKNLAVVFAPAHTFRQLGLENKPAILLGMNAMRAFKKVSIDFAHRRLRVILPQTSEVQTELASKPWFGAPTVGR